MLTQQLQWYFTRTHRKVERVTLFHWKVVNIFRSVCTGLHTHIIQSLFTIFPDICRDLLVEYFPTDGSTSAHTIYYTHVGWCFLNHTDSDRELNGKRREDFFSHSNGVKDLSRTLSRIFFHGDLPERNDISTVCTRTNRESSSL